MDVQAQKNISKRLTKRDKTVISELYDQFGPVLFGIILKIVRSESIAEDVLQESFIKIWQNGPSFDIRKGSLFTWMLNIARNTAIDKTRSAAYRRQLSSQPLNIHIHDNRDFSTEREVDQIGLKKTVDKLDRKYRQIIELIYFQGYTQQEVHEYLNIPLGTVKSRTRIALRKLRGVFENYHAMIAFFLQALLLG